jgi:hypothetical protein
MSTGKKKEISTYTFLRNKHIYNRSTHTHFLSFKWKHTTEFLKQTETSHHYAFPVKVLGLMK